jgi:hypothetical protein
MPYPFHFWRAIEPRGYGKPYPYNPEASVRIDGRPFEPANTAQVGRNPRRGMAILAMNITGRARPELAEGTPVPRLVGAGLALPRAEQRSAGGVPRASRP